MGDFFKLNVISLLYALFLFVPVEFILNIYNISDLTSEQLTIVNTMAAITFLVVILGAGVTLLFPTKKWFGQRKVRYWTALLWLPYFALLVYILTNAFPTIAGEIPDNSIIGWILLATMIGYPFYILLINLFSTR